MVAIEVVTRYRWVVVGIALLAQVNATLVGHVLGPLAPLFQPDLGLSKTEVGLFASATYAGAWAVLMVAGYLTDRFGVRRMISLAQLLPGLILLLMSVVGSALQAMVVMFLAGAARTPVFTGSTKAIMEWFPPTARATAMGVKQTGAPVAGIMAGATLPTLGLLLGWRWAIVVVGIIVIAGGIVSALLYRDPRGSGWAPTHRSSMRSSMGNVVRSRALWILGLLGLLVAIAQQVVVIHLALYFNDVVLVPSLPDAPSRIVAAGGFLAISQAGGVVGRVFWGVVADRMFHGGRAKVLVLVSGLSALTMLALAFVEAGYPLWLLSVVVFVTGLCTIGFAGVYHTLVAEVSGRRYAATGLGLCLTMLEAGAMVGPPLFGLVVDVSGSYRAGWLFVAGTSIGGTLAALLAARDSSQATGQAE